MLTSINTGDYNICEDKYWKKNQVYGKAEVQNYQVHSTKSLNNCRMLQKAGK